MLNEAHSKAEHGGAGTVEAIVVESVAGKAESRLKVETPSCFSLRKPVPQLTCYKFAAPGLTREAGFSDLGWFVRASSSRFRFRLAILFLRSL
jgi:hypothetical protein